jgi:Na+/phosphate symporter
MCLPPCILSKYPNRWGVKRQVLNLIGEWLAFIFLIFFSLLLLGAAIGQIRENKTARFPNRFTPGFFIFMMIAALYVAFKYKPF